MGRRRKSDLSSCPRRMRKAREKARQRRLEQEERFSAMMASLGTANERAGTILKPSNLCRNRNNCNIPEPLAIEPSLEQEDKKSVTDTENAEIVLDFETEEEMDKRWKAKFQL